MSWMRISWHSTQNINCLLVDFLMAWLPSMAYTTYLASRLMPHNLRGWTSCQLKSRFGAVLPSCDWLHSQNPASFEAWLSSEVPSVFQFLLQVYITSWLKFMGHSPRLRAWDGMYDTSYRRRAWAELVGPSDVHHDLRGAGSCAKNHPCMCSETSFGCAL